MKAPSAENFGVLERAMRSAQNFGESFVVFVSGLAVYENNDKSYAQDYARSEAKRVGRDKVSIRRVRV